MTTTPPATPVVSERPPALVRLTELRTVSGEENKCSEKQKLEDALMKFAMRMINESTPETPPTTSRPPTPPTPANTDNAAGKI